MSCSKFCGEPVATVTRKVAFSCGWCFHDYHPLWPSDAERERVPKERLDAADEEADFSAGVRCVLITPLTLHPNFLSVVCIICSWVGQPLLTQHYPPAH